MKTEIDEKKLGVR